MKKSDVVFLSITICVIFGGLFAYFSSSWAIGLGAIVVCACFFVFASRMIKRKDDYMSKDDFINLLLIYGKEKSNFYIKSLYPDITITDGNMVNGDTLVVNNIKFSSLSEEDVACCFRTAKKLGLDKAVIITNQPDKRALNLGYRLDLTISIYNFRKFYSALKSKGLLPKRNVNGVLKKRGIKTILNNMAYIPIKYFAMTSITTALLSVFVPMKLYYLIFALINAVIGIIVFFVNKKVTENQKSEK